MTKQSMKYIFIFIIAAILFYRFTERPQLLYDFFNILVQISFLHGKKLLRP